MALILNNQQKLGVLKALRWFFSNDKSPIFTLCGYAGTGKSTVAKTLIEMIGLRTYQVLFVAPTGKAATVLRSKGNSANTIHSVFYRPIVDSTTHKINFAKKKTINHWIKLIIIDEVSMVSEKMMNDILSFGIPVLALGDPGQLPPIYGENPYLSNPDVFLNQIMRQQGDSGILTLATLARNGDTIYPGKYLESQVIHLRDLNNIEEYDVVLCWTNKARKLINTIIRKKLNLNSYIYPRKGEKLVCLRNDYEQSIIYQEDMIVNPVNGMMMFALNDAKKIKDENALKFSYRPDFINDKQFKGKVSSIIFESYKSQMDDVDKNTFIMSIPEDYTVIDFGYALTVAKSQGSEWDNVLVIDDYHGRGDQKNKWLYTAITRAKKTLTIAVEY